MTFLIASSAGGLFRNRARTIKNPDLRQKRSGTCKETNRKLPVVRNSADHLFPRRCAHRIMAGLLACSVASNTLPDFPLHTGRISGVCVNRTAYSCGSASDSNGIPFSSHIEARHHYRCWKRTVKKYTNHCMRSQGMDHCLNATPHASRHHRRRCIRRIDRRNFSHKHHLPDGR